jgi:hypothetical protein
VKKARIALDFMPQERAVEDSCWQRAKTTRLWWAVIMKFAPLPAVLSSHFGP